MGPNVVFRGQFVERCERCRVERRLCMCACFRPLVTRTRVVVVAHIAEVQKPTSTSRLLLEMLPSAEIHARGCVSRENTHAEIAPTESALVLHPDADDVLTLEDAGTNPVLLVPEGTWPQSRRILRRDPAMAVARRVRLPPGEPSRYRLRESPHDDHVSTLEAVARALGILEGRAIEAALMEVFDVMVERMLVTRGLLHESLLSHPLELSSSTAG